jgi:hypothetical protein
MPLSVKRIGKRYRLVEPDGKIAKNDKGTALDGGGHPSKDRAESQRRAIAIRKSSIELE